MADPIAFLLEKVLPAALSGVGGVLLSVHRIKKSLSDRILILEQKVPQLDGVDKAVDEGDAEVGEKVTALEQKLDKVVINFNNELKRVRQELVREGNRLVALEQRMLAMEHANHEISNRFHQFMKEQNDQWQSMNRTLGQIEGRVRTSISGQMPAVKKP